MTMAGMVVGTVSYMAPEQALGRPIDHRADLFSFGVVLFELLTGRMPFDGSTPTEIIDHILHETPPPPSRYTTGVPPALDAVVARALEKDPTSATSPRARCTATCVRSREMLDAPPRSSRTAIAAASPGASRELGCGDDVREHHARATATTGSGPGSPKPSARISRTSTA